MDMLTLPDLSVMDAERAKLARRQLHSATLWLARLSQSYGLHQDGNRHLRLRWMPKRRSFATQMFAQNLSLELALSMLHLQFMENDRPVPHVLDMEDRTSAATQAWVLVELLHRGIGREKFSMSLPFQIQNALSGDSESYEPAQFAVELTRMTDWFEFGVNVLGNLVADHKLADDVWIYPDQMHAAIRVEPKGRASNGGAPIRIGFSLSDDRNQEPYFFVVPESHGTVQSLRPDSVLSFGVIRERAMAPDNIAGFLWAAVVEKTT
jgi:hypothetical protein